MAQPSQLSRYPPAVIAITGIAAAACIYALYSTYHERPVKDSPPRRSNAVRRRTPRAPITSGHIGEPSLSWPLLSVEGSTGAQDDAPLGKVWIRVDVNTIPIDIASQGIPTDEQFLERYGASIDSAFRDRLNLAIVVGLYEACFVGSTDTEQRVRLRAVSPALEQFADLMGTRPRGLPNIGRDAIEIAQTVLGVNFNYASMAYQRFLDRHGLLGPTPEEADRSYPNTEASVTRRSSFSASDNGHSQGLKGLLYHIAEADEHRQAYEHRGIHCNACHEQPIKGVRWRCLDCASFDLCSTCETNVTHYPTHVFAKVKIPLPTIAQVTHPQPSWYPGDTDPHYNPDGLSSSVRNRLRDEYEFREPQLDALYDRFTTLSNTSMGRDSTHVYRAIDHETFNKALISERWKPRFRPNILFDRIFDFYDTNKDGLICFEEFVSGMAYLRGENRKASLKRALEGFDIDGDGYVDRPDFIRLFRAKHAIQKLLVGDMIQAQEEERTMLAKEDLRSSQPVSAIFKDEDIPAGEVRTTSGKTVDRYGDLQPVQGTKTILEDDEGWRSGINGQNGERVAHHASNEGLQEQLSQVQLPSSTNNDGMHEESRRDGADDSTHLTSLVGDGINMTKTEHSTNAGPLESQSDDEPLDHDALWQLVEEGFHEMLDPLFKAREDSDAWIASTQQERKRWREEIDQVADDIERTKQELQDGAQVDPLMATAMNAFDPAPSSPCIERLRENTSPASGGSLLRSAMVPTDAESLTRREEEIFQQPLQDLLDASGYAVLDGGLSQNDISADPDDATQIVQYGGASVAQLTTGATNGGSHSSDTRLSALSTALSNETYSDPTLPQNRPNSDIPGSGNSHQDGNLNDLSPDGPSLKVADRGEKPPPKARLTMLMHHNQQARDLEARGGFGRLNFEEISRLVDLDDSGELKGMITSWLELASF